MLRLHHMFNLRMDLSGLERRSRVLTKRFGAMIEGLTKKTPELGLSEYMDKVNEAFTETPFIPLSVVWEEQLGRLLEEGT
jgi:hypothetical protein